MGAFILPLCAEVSGICQSGKQYWSSKINSCVDCTKCRNRNLEVVIRPCQIHADTLCGPISALKLEWPGHKPHDHHIKQNEDTHQPHHRNSHVHHHQHQHNHHGHFHHDHNFHDLPLHNPEKDPLKNVEKWERLLKQSRAKLQHKKEDLMRSILERKNAAKHNHENWDDEDDEFDEKNSQSHEFVTHHPHLTKMDLEIVEKLVHSEHKNRNKRPLEPFSLIDERLNRLEHKNQLEKSDSQDDFPEIYDFMAVVPTHRLFLGEPSTVPEMMMDQNIRALEQKVSPERIPFSAAETFVWDWQAVALISAIIACILFFILAGVYSILHARQWRTLKNHFNVGKLLPFIIVVIF